MPSTRRVFLQLGATVSATTLANALIARPLLASLGSHPEPVPPIEDSRLKALVQRGLDVAMQAGAQYADIRLTHDRARVITPGGLVEAEAMTVGVRALVNGYWGFSSSPAWQPNEMARLAQEAVAQARTNALGKSRTVELAPRPRVDDGHWIMPVKIDPFTVHPLEIWEHLGALTNYINRQPYCGVERNQCTLTQQDKAFGASDGSYYTQRTYTTAGALNIVFGARGALERHEGSVEELWLSAVGWELYRDQPIRTYVDRTIEELRQDAKLPLKPIDVGRHEAILSAQAIASILNGSVGAATELDRALGYEANAGGTSYLKHPLEMLGTYQLGAPIVTVTANRTEPGSLAWVQWDDEGVHPEPYTVIQDGRVVGFHTTRESATWLRAKAGHGNVAPKSFGCASAPAADDAPLTHTPNLVLTPGPEDIGFDTMIASLSKGIAFRTLHVDMDFQQLNGFGKGRKIYDIQQGKKVARIAGAGVLFRSPEFWKSITMVGGGRSAQRIPSGGHKGEPPQFARHSITAVPCAVKDLAIIDPMRKA